MQMRLMIEGKRMDSIESPHPCAGAMLIFSVSFQFQYMLINQQIYPLLSPLIYELTKGHKRHFCPQLMSYAHQMQLSDDIFFTFLLKKLKKKLAFFSVGLEIVSKQKKFKSVVFARNHNMQISQHYGKRKWKSELTPGGTRTHNL